MSAAICARPPTSRVPGKTAPMSLSGTPRTLCSSPTSSWVHRGLHMCKLGGRMHRKGTRNTFSSCPFMRFTQNGQNNVNDGQPTSRPHPPPVLAPKGRTKMAPEDLADLAVGCHSKNVGAPRAARPLGRPSVAPQTKSSFVAIGTSTVGACATPSSLGHPQALTRTPLPMIRGGQSGITGHSYVLPCLHIGRSRHFLAAAVSSSHPLLGLLHGPPPTSVPLCTVPQNPGNGFP